MPLPICLKEVVLLFLRLGVTAFGGPAAHIGLMHDEVVKRRQWLSDQEFLDLVGATNLIPGPNSTEAGHPSGLPACRLARVGVGGIVLHRAGGTHRAPFGLGLCALWRPSSG